MADIKNLVGVDINGEVKADNLKLNDNTQLKTTAKDYIGAINELKDGIANVDLSDYQLKADAVGVKQYSTDGNNTILGEKFNSASDASGILSHAEGISTTASSIGSHAEGASTTASGEYSHAEGASTTASGQGSHAEGVATTASGSGSHAEGVATTASGHGSHVQGKYNIVDTEDKYSHIVGNGENKDNRSNAHTIDWDGNAWFSGDVRVGGTSYENGKKLLTEDDLPNTDLSIYQTKNDNTLNTTDKTVVGGINEVKGKTDTAYTHSQSTHAPVNAQKNSDITKAEIEAKLTGAITSHTHNYSTLALGETSTTAYRGDRGATAYTHSQSTHAPSNAQKNSDITKAEIEAKLTGVITSHSHSATFDGGWELLADTGVLTPYLGGDAYKNLNITTLSKEYSQIKLELTLDGVQFVDRAVASFKDLNFYISSSSNGREISGKKILVLNRCDHQNNDDFTCKSFNSGLYNPADGVNIVDFKSSQQSTFQIVRYNGSMSDRLCYTGTVQFRLYGRL